MNYDAASQQAYDQGQVRQQQLDTQSQQQQQQNAGYNQAAQAAQAAQADYSKNIPDLGAYAENKLASQYKQLGVDPNAIANTAQRMAQQSAALVAAPQAAAQAGNYGGATAGQTQQGLDYTQSTLGNALAQSTGQLNALQVNLKQAADNANMITQAEQATVKDKIDSLNNVAVNAANLLQTSNQTMVSIENLAQQQGYVTSQQVSEYQKAKAASAAAAESAAHAAYYAALTTGENIKNQASQQQLDTLLKNNGEAMKHMQQDPNTKAYKFTNNSNQPVSAGAYALNYGIPFTTLVRSMAYNGDTGAQKIASAVGDDLGYNPNMIGNNGNIFNAFIWGTGAAQAPAGGTPAAPYRPPTVTPLTGGSLVNKLGGR